MKTELQSEKGGLLVGQTDKDGGKGIMVSTPEGQIKMGGGEIIINEEAAKTHCQELSDINESTGGVKIPCEMQKQANTSSPAMESGGEIRNQETMEEETKYDFKSGAVSHEDKNILNTCTLSWVTTSDGRHFYKVFDGIRTHEDVYNFYKERGYSVTHTIIETINHTSKVRDLYAIKQYIEKLVKEKFDSEINPDSLIIKYTDHGDNGFTIDDFEFELKDGSKVTYNAKDQSITKVLATGGKIYTEPELNDTENEIMLFIENDSDLYRQRTQPIYKNLITKLSQGKYNRDLASKLFIYLVEAGDKKYQQDVGPPSTGAYYLTVPERKNLAKYFEYHFYNSAKNGEFDGYIPAKYKKSGLQFEKDQSESEPAKSKGGEVPTKSEGGEIPETTPAPSLESMETGGKIPDQYVGKTPSQVWTEWNHEQRRHFMIDHHDEIFGVSLEQAGALANAEKMQAWEKLKYSKLPKKVKDSLDTHVSMGQYSAGGEIPERKEEKEEPKSTETILSLPADHDYQTIIFDNSKFSKAKAIRWTKEHGFSYKFFTRDQTPNSHRFRQMKQSKFKPTTLKRADLADGVTAIIGILRANIKK